MNQKLIRVLLVDDHQLVREGIKASLSSYPDITIIGEAADGIEAIEKATELKPDVVLLDFSMPKMNGLEVAKTLQNTLTKIGILVLTMHNKPEYLRRFLELGVRGYLSKDSSPSELIKAVRSVSLGKEYIGSEIDSGSISKSSTREMLEELSKREQEVLKLLATSSRSKDIAAHLGISVRTVEKHRSQIMRKLKIDNVAGLTRYALSFEI